MAALIIIFLLSRAVLKVTLWFFFSFFCTYVMFKLGKTVWYTKSPSNLVKLLIIVVLNQMKSKTKLNVDFWERETGAPREKSQGRVNKINKFNPHIASFPEVRLVES